MIVRIVVATIVTPVIAKRAATAVVVMKVDALPPGAEVEGAIRKVISVDLEVISVDLEVISVDVEVISVDLEGNPRSNSETKLNMQVQM